MFLYAQGWKYTAVAGFVAVWTIGYGVVQALAPSVLRRSADGLSREIPEARLWGAMLTAIPVALALLLQSATAVSPGLLVVVGLGIFGFAFAVISSLHSYLILAYAGSKKAAEDVGFYYAANAGGRLFGIVLSGALTQSGGMPACLWGSAVMLALCPCDRISAYLERIGTRHDDAVRSSQSQIGWPARRLAVAPGAGADRGRAHSSIFFYISL